MQRINFLKSLVFILVCFIPPVHSFEGDYIWDERFKIMLEKVNSGLAKDQYTLGEMYYRGRGTPIEHIKAIRWFQRAAKQGHQRAAFKVGILYLKGKGILHSPKKALRWFKKSSQAGYAPAQYELGMLYQLGSAGKQDRTLALKWLGKAMASGFAPASDAFSQVVGDLVKNDKH